MLRRFTSYAKPVILAILVYACIGIAAPQTSRANAVSLILGVPTLGQENGNWCWAASARMVMVYKNYQAPSQCALVNSAWGVWNCPNWVGTVYDAAVQLRNQGLRQSEGFYGRLTMPQIQYQIDRYQPVIAAWRSGFISGHMVVIRGYYTSYYSNVVYYTNPAGSGFQDLKTYSDFVIQWDHEWTHTVWKNTW